MKTCTRFADRPQIAGHTDVPPHIAGLTEFIPRSSHTVRIFSNVTGRPSYNAGVSCKWAVSLYLAVRVAACVALGHLAGGRWLGSGFRKA